MLLRWEVWDHTHLGTTSPLYLIALFAFFTANSQYTLSFTGYFITYARPDYTERRPKHCPAQLI